MAFATSANLLHWRPPVKKRKQRVTSPRVREAQLALARNFNNGMAKCNKHPSILGDVAPRTALGKEDSEIDGKIPGEGGGGKSEQVDRERASGKGGRRRGGGCKWGERIVWPPRKRTRGPHPCAWAAWVAGAQVREPKWDTLKKASVHTIFFASGPSQGPESSPTEIAGPRPRAFALRGPFPAPFI